MFYDTYYLGMHPIWWSIWLLMLFWIFATPYDFPGQRNRRETPFSILQKRFAAGQITKEKYHEMRKFLEDDRSGKR
jgi:putative membrane protein